MNSHFNCVYHMNKIQQINNGLNVNEGKRNGKK